MKEEKVLRSGKDLLLSALTRNVPLDSAKYVLSTIFRIPIIDKMRIKDVQYLREYMLECPGSYRVDIGGVFFERTPFTDDVYSPDDYLYLMQGATGCDAHSLINFDFLAHFGGFVQPCEIERIEKRVIHAWNRAYRCIKVGDFVRSINASDPICMYRVSAIKNDPFNASRTLIESDLCIFDDGITLFGDGIYQVSPKEFPISTLARVSFKDAESKLKSIWNLIYNNNE